MHPPFFQAFAFTFNLWKDSSRLPDEFVDATMSLGELAVSGCAVSMAMFYGIMSRLGKQHFNGRLVSTAQNAAFLTAQSHVTNSIVAALAAYAKEAKSSMGHMVEKVLGLEEQMQTLAAEVRTGTVRVPRNVNAM